MGRRAKPETSGVEKTKRKKLPPAASPEARENQLIALAYDLVEKRLQEGTATSQETTHFLKMGSPKERLEKEILEKQKKLMDAKANALESHKRMETIYEEVLTAMRAYGGISDEVAEDEND